MDNPAPPLAAGWLGDRVVGWLVGWLAGLLVGWLAGLLVGWLAGGLVGWLVSWLAGRVAGWLGCWLFAHCWLLGWLVGCLAGWLVGCLAGWLVLVVWKAFWAPLDFILIYWGLDLYTLDHEGDQGPHMDTKGDTSGPGVEFSFILFRFRNLCGGRF